MTQKPLAAIRFPPCDADLDRPATLLSLPVSEPCAEIASAAICDAVSPAQSAIAAWLEQSAKRRQKTPLDEPIAAPQRTTPAIKDRQRRFVPRTGLIDIVTEAIIDAGKNAGRLCAEMAQRVIHPQMTQSLAPVRVERNVGGATSAVRVRKLEGWLWLGAAALTGTCGVALVMGTWHGQTSASIDAVPTKGATANSATQIIPATPNTLPASVIRASGSENSNSSGRVQAAVYEIPGRPAARGAWLTGAIIEEDHIPTRPAN